MIGMYLTDEITIVRRTFDINGVPTDSSTTGIKARVEDYNKMLRDINGNEVIGSMLVITDYSDDINYEDLIKVTKKNGVAYELDEKEFAILKIENADGFMKSHKEIYLGAMR
jgi:hypothetical protein